MIPKESHQQLRTRLRSLQRNCLKDIKQGFKKRNDFWYRFALDTVYHKVLLPQQFINRAFCDVKTEISYETLFYFIGKLKPWTLQDVFCKLIPYNYIHFGPSMYLSAKFLNLPVQKFSWFALFVIKKILHLHNNQPFLFVSVQLVPSGKLSGRAWS